MDRKLNTPEQYDCQTMTELKVEGLLAVKRGRGGDIA
jgi:DNA-binding IscR family transcriptional regulator